MLSHFWNSFVVAVAILAGLGAFVFAGGLAGYPGGAVKVAVFAVFAIGFLGSVSGALFIRHY